MSSKNRGSNASAKSVKSAAAKPAAALEPAAPAAAKPAPKKRDPDAPDTRTFEYPVEKVEEVGLKLAELATSLPKKEGPTPKTEKNTTRNIIRKNWPSIKVLIEKGYTKKFICDKLNEQGVKVQIATFLNACKAMEKEDKAAAEKAKSEGINVDMQSGVEPAIPGEKATEAELADAAKEAGETHPGELIESDSDIVTI